MESGQPASQITLAVGPHRRGHPRHRRGLDEDVRCHQDKPGGGLGTRIQQRNRPTVAVPDEHRAAHLQPIQKFREHVERLEMEIVR